MLGFWQQDLAPKQRLDSFFLIFFFLYTGHGLWLNGGGEKRELCVLIIHLTLNNL